MGEAGDDRLDRKRIDVGCAFVKEKKNLFLSTSWTISLIFFHWCFRCACQCELIKVISNFSFENKMIFNEIFYTCMWSIKYCMFSNRTKVLFIELFALQVLFHLLKKHLYWDQYLLLRLKLCLILNINYPLKSNKAIDTSPSCFLYGD